MLRATYMLPLKKKIMWQTIKIQEKKFAVELLSVHNFVKDSQHSIYEIKSTVLL